MIKKFEMQVKDIFRFQDGRMVFVGSIEGEETIVHECTCDLLVDGQVEQTIQMEGEMLACRKQSSLRSLSTKESVNVSDIKKSIVLKCHDYT